MSDGSAIKHPDVTEVVVGQGRGRSWWRKRFRLNGVKPVVVKAHRRFRLRTALALVALATVLIWAVNDSVMRSRWHRFRDRPMAAWDAVLAGVPSPRAQTELHQVLLLVLADPNVTEKQFRAVLESLADLEPTQEELPLLRAPDAADRVTLTNGWQWSVEDYRPLVGALARHGQQAAPSILMLLKSMEDRFRRDVVYENNSRDVDGDWSWSCCKVLDEECIARLSEFLPAHLKEELRPGTYASWTLPVLVLFESAADDQLGYFQHLLKTNDEGYGLLGIQSMGARGAPVATNLVQSMKRGYAWTCVQIEDPEMNIYGGGRYGAYLRTLAGMGESARSVIGDLEELARRREFARVQPSFGACIVHLDSRNEAARQQLFSLLDLDSSDLSVAKMMNEMRRQFIGHRLRQDFWCEENAWRILAPDLREPVTRALASGRIEPVLWVVSSLCLPEIDEWGMRRTPVDPALLAEMVELLAQDGRIQTEVELLLRRLKGGNRQLTLDGISESALIYDDPLLQPTNAPDLSLVALAALDGYPVLALLARPQLPSLIDALDRTRDPETARTVLLALLAIDSSDPRVQAALERALRADDQDTRLLAANKLRSIGSPRSLWLAPRLRDLRNSCK